MSHENARSSAFSFYFQLDPERTKRKLEKLIKLIACTAIGPSRIKKKKKNSIGIFHSKFDAAELGCGFTLWDLSLGLMCVYSQCTQDKLRNLFEDDDDDDERKTKVIYIYAINSHRG